MANQERRLKPLRAGYIRKSEMKYIQWKLDYAAGMRIAIKRFIDAAEKEEVSFGKRSWEKLNELIQASDDFQNYQPDSSVV